MQPILVIQHEADDPPARLGEWLVSAGATLDVRRAHDGDEIPATMDGYDGLLVLGGAPGAFDDGTAPWLPKVRALIGVAVRAEVPTLGVCLGAQLLAVATGGRVERGAQGPELGPGLIAKRAATATDPLFGPMPITPDVIQWHYDVVTELPTTAVLLASSPVYENQAFRVGRLAWGIQGHIETTAQIVRLWADTDPDVADFDLTRLLERSDAIHADIEEVWAPFAARFVDVVRDPDSVRPRRGPVVATAAPVDDPAAIRAALAGEMQSARMPLTFGRPPETDDR